MKESSKLPIVWQLSALQVNKRTLINGVLLKDIPYSSGKKGALRNLIKLIRLYFTRTYSNKNITIHTNNNAFETTTDEKGHFQIILENEYSGAIDVKIPGHQDSLQIVQDYPIIFKNTQSKIDVISDIDETIIVSNTSSFFKRISTLAFHTARQREVISFTKKLLIEFQKQHSRTVYVSKSESNLFRILTTFIKYNSLPQGKLFLTSHLNAGQLITGDKKTDFKKIALHFIIGNTAPKNYILIGDDSQRDMDIYYGVTQKYPGRILKIYIRLTKPGNKKHKSDSKNKLATTGIPVQYFKPEDTLDASQEFYNLNS